MNIWFILILAIYMLSLGVVLSQHGKKQEGKHNFWISLATTSIFISIVYMAIKTGF